MCGAGRPATTGFLFPTSIIGCDDEIVSQADAETVHYEGELSPFAAPASPVACPWSVPYPVGGSAKRLRNGAVAP